MKRAIVLGGGGARGPYQIGVWRALRELGIEYSIITGSSVGALNGALMVQDDYDAAKSMWESITTADVIAHPPEGKPDSPQYMLDFARQAAGQGGFDISPLEERVRRAVDERKVRESPIEYGIVTTQYPFLKPVQLRKAEIPEGELVDYMLASSSWFPFFRRRTIDGVDYVDGAYADNLPAELAVKCGAEEILAVDLQGAGIVRTFRGDIPVRYIRSHWNLGDMLAFDPEQARRNMRLGYQDGLKAYRRLEGNAYAFAPGDTRKNVILLRGALDRIRRRTGVSLFKQRDRLPRIQETLCYHGNDQRFLQRKPESPTLGRAVTTAAEITGEILRIPPDRIYRLRGFNKLLLEQAVMPMTAATAADKRARTLLARMLSLLRDGYTTGRTPDAFWHMAAIYPVQFVAANYLLALQLHYRLYESL